MSAAKAAVETCLRHVLRAAGAAVEEFLVLGFWFSENRDIKKSSLTGQVVPGKELETSMLEGVGFFQVLHKIKFLLVKFGGFGERQAYFPAFGINQSGNYVADVSP